MSPIGRSMRRRRALATAAAVAALAVTATACGPEDDDADAKPSESTTQVPKDLKEELGLPDELPKDLPAAIEDLRNWRDGGWKDWDREKWLREAEDFINPIIEDFWNTDRMDDAKDNEPERDVDESDIDQGVTDPVPEPVKAAAVPTPYTGEAPPVGKIFMETPEGSMVCSGAVVKDPKNPGKSNLVATAGHCVHGGKGKGWFRNVVFVPHFNSEGLGQAELEGAPKSDVAPHGVYWAQHARTTDHWIRNGATQGGSGAPQDFAVLKVKPEDGGGTSLEETVGDAVTVNFDTPGVKNVASLTARGYPAAPPFSGETMYACEDEPGRLSLDASQPTMYRIGCTMTGGSSGGPWLSADGEELLSVTSIGPVTHDWLAGAALGKEAEAVFDAVGGLD
ncbi:trypsin-like serine peptidase [Streptomyces sp. NPDC054784]